MENSWTIAIKFIKYNYIMLMRYYVDVAVQYCQQGCIQVGMLPIGEKQEEKLSRNYKKDTKQGRIVRFSCLAKYS